MVMYVIVDPDGDDSFICEDVEVCLANMGPGEKVFSVTYQEVDRELIGEGEILPMPEGGEDAL